MQQFFEELSMFSPETINIPDYLHIKMSWDGLARRYAKAFYENLAFNNCTAFIRISDITIHSFTSNMDQWQNTIHCNDNPNATFESLIQYQKAALPCQNDNTFVFLYADFYYRNNFSTPLTSICVTNLSDGNTIITAPMKDFSINHNQLIPQQLGGDFGFSLELPTNNNDNNDVYDLT